MPKVMPKDPNPGTMPVPMPAVGRTTEVTSHASEKTDNNQMGPVRGDGIKVCSSPWNIIMSLTEGLPLDY